MTQSELNKCLQKFYLSARKRDGTYYNKKSLTAIRAAIDRHLRSSPISKPFSIIGSPEFQESNQTLNCFVKTLSKKGEIAPTVHKRPRTKEIVESLYEAGEQLDVNTLQPQQLQQTPWFVISLFLGQRGRENQTAMKKYMLIKRQTPSGEKYWELNRQRLGAVLATKNHQEGLTDHQNESDGKILERPGSLRCPFRIVDKYLSHLNPNCSNLFQRPRTSSKKFNPAVDNIWFCDSPLGHNSLEQIIRKMTTQAGVYPYLTNHCLRAKTITVLNSFFAEGRHVTAVNGHKSVESIKPYCDRPMFQQFRRMSHMLASFVDENTASSSNATANPSSSSAFPPALLASLAPPATAQVPAVSSTANLAIGVNDGNQLLRGLIPGGTFTNCQFTFNLNSWPTSNE